jgi:Lar family restriction alleviation protein
MSTDTNEREALPCPFCGAVGLDFGEGSTFRWITATCSGCGATTGETRIQTFGEGTRDEWLADAKQDAIAAWNRRAALSTPPAAADHWQARALAAEAKLAAQTAAVQPATPCAGKNCGTTTAQHSRECIAEHAAAVAGGRFVKAPDDVSEHFAMSKFASRADRDAAMLREIASLREANSTLASASIVPEGMALVPREPTDGMEAAAENAYEDCGNPFPSWKTAWRAMVAAALQGDGNG